LTTSFSQRYLMVRGTSTFLNYLHLDALLTGLVIVTFLFLGAANNFNVFRSLEARLPAFSISTEASRLPPPAVSATQGLTPAMAAALDNVAQRYRVSAEALLPVFEEAQAAGRERRLDPLLIIAVIAIESRFNPFSQSVVGAQGLMQIVPRYHQDKLPRTPTPKPFLDPVMNVRIGSQVLQEAIRRQGGLVEGLQYYGGATDDGEQTYANKVLAEKLRLEQVARRKEGPGA
jgi:hypothetical protein